MKNNLFQFATKELSQDALICWIINAFNYQKEDEIMYNLSIKVLKKILPNNIKISNIKQINIQKQFCRIDILHQ